MEFALNEDQVELQQVLRGFLIDKCDESVVRAALDDPATHDRKLWTQLSDQLGLPSLTIPEDYGGSGFTFVELALVMEELGRSLAVVPYLTSSVMATELLLQVGDREACHDLLPRLASGETLATVAIAEESGTWHIDSYGVRATETGDGWILDGSKSFVLDGAVADIVLVVAESSDGPAVFVVESGAGGLTTTPLHTMDLTRKQASVELRRTPARRLADGGRARDAVSTMLDRTAVAVAAEALGGAGRVLEMAVEYAKIREQFGRPIGSFQAIKHKCASMLVDLEASRSAVYYASWSAAVGHEDAAQVASLAKAFCVDAYLAAAGENIQIHGGIGFTWEHPAHLYFKRAKNLQSFLGGSDFHRQLLADRIGI